MYGRQWHNLSHVAMLLCMDANDTILVMLLCCYVWTSMTQVMLLAEQVSQHVASSWTQCHHCSLPGQVGLMTFQHSFLSNWRLWVKHHHRNCDTGHILRQSVNITGSSIQQECLVEQLVCGELQHVKCGTMHSREWHLGLTVMDMSTL